MICIDQIVKVLIFSAAGQQVGAQIFGKEFSGVYLQKLFLIFDLTFVKNTGAAYGIFQGGARYLVWISLTVGMGILFYFSNPSNYRKLERITQISWALISAGALGNAIDRLGRGWVIDFLDINRTGFSLLDNFPVWNVADACVVVGVILLLLPQGRKSKR